MLSTLQIRKTIENRNKSYIKIIFINLFIISSFVFGQIDDEVVFLRIDNDWVEKLDEKNVSELNENNIDSSIDSLFVKTKETPHKKISESIVKSKENIVSIEYNSVLDAYINKYSSYKWFGKVLGLFDFYEPLFEAKLMEYGLPTDLKYLPIIESAMNPKAVSHAGAMGLWQFMPATGYEYGLINNSEINTFYDPVHSTTSACKYLKYLYSLFGDWNLVISAYNSGQGTVLNAIKKAGTKNYWIVRNYLPEETKAYVPSFHAVKTISENRNKYNVSVKKFFIDYRDVKIIKTNNPVEINNVANKTGKDIRVLAFLNPHIVNNRSKYFYTY